MKVSGVIAICLGIELIAVWSGASRLSNAWAKPLTYVPLGVPSHQASVKPTAHTLTHPTPQAKSALSAKIDFATQVQPILAASCYSCHGPEVHKGKLRLDTKQFALAGGFSGAAIVPGSSEKSYLVKRILGAGNEARMPLGSPALTPQQIATIRAWIDQGATWPESAAVTNAAASQHWAFVKPVHYLPPAVKNTAWVRNPLDNFILARLEKEGLHPAPEADRATLIRRVSLDLIGLPPTPEEVDAFIADKSPNAYEKVVDRLLASPHYGEQWGRHWLDIARYADTNGYEKDRARTIWPYRDWVINSINADMPFDEFTVEQIAGDMLPHATTAQKIATGFHRNTMINEEGGIDVEEFRYKALVDRVQTTSTAFLGLTLQCAQCHNHKYDPLSQKEYYQFYAFLNNADEPELNIPTPEVLTKRAETQAKIAAIEANYENDFPAGEETLDWQPLKPDKLTASSGANLQAQADRTILATGPVPETDKYTVVVHTDLKDISALRLETLTDPSLPKNGPGRAGGNGNGNFVISEFKVTAAPTAGGEPKPVTLTNAQADVAQHNFAVANAIDGKPETGWAVDDLSGHFNQNHTATFQVQDKIGFDGGTILTFTIEQNYSHHTLGKFRLWAEHKLTTPTETSAQPIAERKRQFLDTKLAAWEKEVALKCAHWTVLDPSKFARTYGATITKLDDKSLLFTGDNYYRDQYDLEYNTPLKNITGIRLEVLPHPDLPNGGPGRNPTGGFLLSELNASAAPLDKPDTLSPVTLQNATADYGSAPQNAIDGKRDTHWTAPNGDAQPHTIVFQVKDGLTHEQGSHLALALVENYHQQENIGRLRISVTEDKGPITASSLPADVEAIVLTPEAQRTAEQQARLKQCFLSVTPLLDAQHKQIAALRAAMPHYQTTMAMQERATPRSTRIHKRGEFLNLGDEVTPGVPAVLQPLPKDAPLNRLTLARWLVDKDNPLVARVVMNRAWAIFFGRGLVNTVEDFGVMGERPSHPELLDWLATEFMRRGWSTKAMHRLIVTSATYRQASRVTPQLLQRDPSNVLLARGPRFRVEAETVRDVALAASGLLDPKIGGPSVYPPQPDGVVDLSWGPMRWNTSEGGDRYRRGLYTFLKRTSPYPGLITFDSPTADLVCPRRMRSNTPLQALTLLNDAVFVEAAQALAQRVMTYGPTDVAARARYAFRLCVARQPEPRELKQLVTFYNSQLDRFQTGAADPAAVALSDPKHPPQNLDLPQLAAWTTVARALLNLDETVTKE